MYCISNALIFAACSLTTTERDSSNDHLKIIGDATIGSDLAQTIRPEHIIKNGIIKVSVRNCIEQSSCYEDHFWFNECGKVIEHYPPMISSWRKYEYDDNCRLTRFTQVGWLQHDYTYLTNDSVREDIIIIDEEHPDTTTHITKFKMILSQDGDAEFNEDGYITIDSLGGLMYPCGIDLPGPHVAYYHYYENGLVKYIEIFDSINQPEVELEYAYYGKDTTRLIFD